jgi:hypothetical protein
LVKLAVSTGTAAQNNLQQSPWFLVAWSAKELGVRSLPLEPPASAPPEGGIIVRELPTELSLEGAAPLHLTKGRAVMSRELM